MGFSSSTGQLSSPFVHGITVWSNYSCLLDSSESLLSSPGWPAVTLGLNSIPSSPAQSSLLSSSLCKEMSPFQGVFWESLWATHSLTVSPGWMSIVLGELKKSEWTLGEPYRLESYNFINWIFPSYLFYPTWCPNAAILERTLRVFAKIYPSTHALPSTR